MVTSLDSLWIINNHGLCLLHRIFDLNKEYTDETMLSGLLTAISSFTTKATDDAIEKISMGKVDVHFRSFEDFYVIVSTKKGQSPRHLPHLIVEIGESFRIQYGAKLKSSLVDTEIFEPFSVIIDQIFGVETIKVIPEHRELLGLLEQAEKNAYSEEKTVNLIIDFYAKLDDSTKRILLKTTKNILSLFISSKTLSNEQRDKLEEVYKYTN